MELAPKAKEAPSALFPPNGVWESAVVGVVVDEFGVVSTDDIIESGPPPEQKLNGVMVPPSSLLVAVDEKKCCCCCINCCCGFCLKCKSGTVLFEFDIIFK